MAILSGGSSRRESLRPRRDGGRGSPASRGCRRMVRWPAPRRRLDAAPTGCRPTWWRVVEIRWPPRCSAGRWGRRRRLRRWCRRARRGHARRSARPAVRCRLVDSAFEDGGSTARSTSPLWDSSHCPSVNGADADGSIGMPMLAERTAATTQSLLNAGATEANDASPHSGAALRHRRAHAAGRRSRRPSRRRSSGRASAVGGHTTGPAAPTVARAPATRSIAVLRASRGVGTSGVPGQAHAREDLPPDRVVPVAEARPQDARRDRP